MVSNVGCVGEPECIRRDVFRRKEPVSFMSGRVSCLCASIRGTHSDRILLEFNLRDFYENLSMNSKFRSNRQQFRALYAKT
jgi:hypothetical protein